MLLQNNLIMKSFLKFLYRLYKSHLLRRKNVWISPYCFFYQSTVFEGNNKIAKGASVSGAFVDRNTYLGTDSDFHNCKIGRFCSIASNIKVIAETHPSSVLFLRLLVFSLY